MGSMPDHRNAGKRLKRHTASLPTIGLQATLPARHYDAALDAKCSTVHRADYGCAPLAPEDPLASYFPAPPLVPSFGLLP